jgi:hypothetical protein
MLVSSISSIKRYAVESSWPDFQKHEALFFFLLRVQARITILLAMDTEVGGSLDGREQRRRHIFLSHPINPAPALQATPEVNVTHFRKGVSVEEGSQNHVSPGDLGRTS